MKVQFLARLTKQDTGKLNVFSTAIVSQFQSEKLAFIFLYYSGMKQDFWVHFDEFSQERVQLSRIHLDVMPVSEAEIQSLQRLGLKETGILNPLDLIEEFEARMGEILRTRSGEYYLEGEILDEESD